MLVVCRLPDFSGDAGGSAIPSGRESLGGGGCREAAAAAARDGLPGRSTPPYVIPLRLAYSKTASAAAVAAAAAAAEMSSACMTHAQTIDKIGGA